MTTDTPTITPTTPTNDQRSERPAHGSRGGGRPMGRGGRDRGGRGGDRPAPEFDHKILAISRVTRVV